eukprot:TRINITY_DN10822_c0_g1_i1.p2 TRINITY_DN10822_c0_g1~~TRINITY_DN10822_c0_g1_i1.p2  ORF type:complete len:167 (-),score=59.24 TRINITY_DN10822_c0_g1_i1:86-586(-)
MAGHRELKMFAKKSVKWMVKGGGPWTFREPEKHLHLQKARLWGLEVLLYVVHTGMEAIMVTGVWGWLFKEMTARRGRHTHIWSRLLKLLERMIKVDHALGTVEIVATMLGLKYEEIMIRWRGQAWRKFLSVLEGLSKEVRVMRWVMEGLDITMVEFTRYTVGENSR